MARARKSSTQIVTANRLTDGAVIFLSEDGTWTTIMSEATVAAGPAVAETLLATGERDAAAARVVGPYLVAVDVAEGVVVPTALRERIRASGLTFRAIAADAVAYF
jgi:hypothetical protein